MCRALFMTAVFHVFVANLSADDLRQPTPQEPTWDVVLENCPLFYLSAVLGSQGVPIDIETEASVPTFVDAEGIFFFRSPAVTFQSRQGSTAEILNAFVEQNEFYRWEQHPTYGYRVFPKLLSNLNGPIKPVTAEGTVIEVLKHPALKTATRLWVHPETRVVKVDFPGGTLRDALSCLARTVDGRYVNVHYSDNVLRMGLNDSYEEKSKRRVSKIRIQYDLMPGEPNKRTLTEAYGNWQIRDVKGEWMAIGAVHYQELAVRGQTADERGACKVCVNFMRSLLSLDWGGMQEYTPRENLVWKGRTIQSDDMSKLVEELSPDVKGVLLGDLFDKPTWKYQPLPNGRMQVSIASKLSKGPFANELIFICEKKPDSPVFPAEYLVVEFK